jgi:hypothetical protein
MITSAETSPLTPRAPVILLEGRLPMFEAPAVAALGLRDGQVVRPLVEARDGQLQLLLQGLAVAVPPQLRLAVGIRTPWQVRLDANGRATLVPVDEDTLGTLAPAEAGREAPAQRIAQTTAGRLAQLALRPPAMSSLAALMQPGALAALFQAAPQSGIGAQIEQVLRQWPQTSQITPELLRRMVRQGGWTQEAVLARGQKPPVGEGPDIKSILRDLLSDWTESSPATRALLQGSLDDIESRQLQSAIDTAAGRDLVFSMVLPFADASPVQVRWARARERGQEGEGGASPWVVDLHTRSSVFGEVWLRTRISDRNRVELVMWAQRAELVAQARASSPSLTAWLQEVGLRMTSIQIIHGSPPPGIEPTGAPAGESGRLVDLRA